MGNTAPTCLHTGGPNCSGQRSIANTSQNIGKVYKCQHKIWMDGRQKERRRKQPIEKQRSILTFSRWYQRISFLFPSKVITWFVGCVVGWPERSGLPVCRQVGAVFPIE